MKIKEKIKGYYNRQINRMGKKQKITFYTASVILVLLVLLCVGGLAYSWFSSIITGNDIAQGDVVQTGTLSIVYTNGQEIRGGNITPGWSETKTFTVENIGTVEATYNINWENLTNTFVNKQDLVLTLTSTNGGGTLDETQISDSGNHIGILTNITIAPSVTQTYTMTITYKNQNYDQSSDMGKELIGKIEVLDRSETQTGGTLASEYIIAKATEGNTEGLITLEQLETGQTPAQTEYRYSGSNDVVKNYVNFNNETWRIIGVFPTDDGTGNIENRVKIIREESIGEYSWDTSPSTINSGYGINQWGESGSYEGADLMRLFNPGYESESVNNSLYWNRESGNCYNYFNNSTITCDFSSIGLTEESKNMIDNAVWYTAASDYDISASETYINERGNRTGTEDIGITITKTTSWIGKVGLMYPSDYAYASSGCRNGEQTLLNYNNEACTTTNWLYKNRNAWLIVPVNFDEHGVRHLYSSGEVRGGDSGASALIYPALYLKAEIRFASGTGSKSDPFILL